MIVTVTPNPSVDRTIGIGSLDRGTVHRATSTRVDPGGKGINVSRAIGCHGGDTLALLPLGGAHGRMMAELLESAGTPTGAYPISGATRANVAVVEPDGTTTKFNEPGPQLSAEEVGGFLDAVRDAVAGAPGAWIVGCGSLPGGMEVDFYADLVRLAHDHGCRAAVDTSGAPLAAGVPAGPDLIKPNRVELGELVGADLTTVGEVVEASRELIAGGVGRLLVSLGKDGALLVTPDVVRLASARVERPLSTVGAGDCTLAGYLLALDQHPGEDEHAPEDALTRSVAFGAAAVALPGTEVPSPDHVAAIEVSLDRDPSMSLVLTD